MLIVIDMQGAQTESRFRGIGRYTMALVKEMARQRGEHEIILALNAAYPETIEPIRAAFGGLLPFDAIRVFEVAGPVGGHDSANDARRNAAEVMLEAFYASFDPDVIFIPALFEGIVGAAVTSVHAFQTTIPTVVTLHDLIPLIHRDIYLQDTAVSSYGQDWCMSI
ncbi:glycosyltransferase family 4 protein, partial [Acidithiobacillus caldus]